MLVVDDEPDLLTLMQLTLTKLGLEVVTADCRESALAALDRQTYSLCLTDMQLGDGTGLDVLAAIAERGLDLPCAVITAFGNADNAVAALKAGRLRLSCQTGFARSVADLVKSAIKVPERRIGAATAAASPWRWARQRRSRCGQCISERTGADRRVAHHRGVAHAAGQAGQHADASAYSRRIRHRQGTRRTHPACIGAARQRPSSPSTAVQSPRNLMESEFFGYRKGAFTGAESDRDGFFQAARRHLSRRSRRPAAAVAGEAAARHPGAGRCARWAALPKTRLMCAS